MFVDRIFVSSERGAPQIERDHVEVRASMGAVGDRNFGVSKHPGQNLTLVEAEEIERFCAERMRTSDLSLMRRNLVTRGVRLNELVDVEFKIGQVKVRGVELCEPCVVIAAALSDPSLPVSAVVKWWVGRAGLRVDVLTSGEIARGALIDTAA